MGTRSGDGAVNDEFGGGEVRGVGADVVGVFDEVPPDGEASSFGFGLLRSVVTDDAAVRDGAVGWNFQFGDEEDGIRALDAVSNTLGKAA